MAFKLIEAAQQRAPARPASFHRHSVRDRAPDRTPSSTSTRRGPTSPGRDLQHPGAIASAIDDLTSSQGPPVEGPIAENVRGSLVVLVSRRVS